MNDLTSSVFVKRQQADLLTDEERALLNLRKRIRRVAQSPNLQVDESQHYGSDNLSLKKFLESCGANFEDFVREYLLNLQPFMIHLNKERSRSSADFSCVIDPAYRIPLWVEFYYTQHKEQIISFHEMNWYSQQCQNIYNAQTELLFVADMLMPGEVGLTTAFTGSVQKGLCHLELGLVGTRISEHCVRVKRKQYEAVLLAECNRMLSEVLQDELGVFNFEHEKQLSFTSYGSRLQNEISMILDLYSSTKDPRLTVPLAVKVEQLALSGDYADIKEALVSKYLTYDGVDYSHLL